MMKGLEDVDREFLEHVGTVVEREVERLEPVEGFKLGFSREEANEYAFLKRIDAEKDKDSNRFMLDVDEVDEESGITSLVHFRLGLSNGVTLWCRTRGRVSDLIVGGSRHYERRTIVWTNRRRTPFG